VITSETPTNQHDREEEEEEEEDEEAPRSALPFARSLAGATRR
jgi:hypothetical protein